jgi:proline dehydrogenase
MARADRAVLFRLATSDRFERAVRSRRPGERRAWRSARRYVAGVAQEDATRVALELARRGVGASLDCFGEQVADPDEARAAADRYVGLARALSTLPDGAWLSVDLSHVGLDVSAAFCRSQLDRIASELPPGRLIQVGAEDSARADRVLDVLLTLARDGAPVGATLQANLRRSDRDAARLSEAGVHVRLVKGAYVEAPELARPYGDETDLAFVSLAHEIAAGGARLALATHDRVLREALLPALPDAECELLLGVRGQDAYELARRGRTVRVYVPFGDDWFRYWMRRLAESRGA